MICHLQSYYNDGVCDAGRVCAVHAECNAVETCRVGYARGRIVHVEYMREFLVVADEGSVSVAASKLHITQPVLSKHIRAMEDTLNVQLFLRSPKGLTLTPRGKQAYHTFKDIVSRYDDIVCLFQPENNVVCGQLRMGILSMGFDRYIAPVVERFNRQYPNIAISYATENPLDIVDGIIDGDLDIGFLGQARFDDKGQISYRRIGKDVLHAIVPKGGPVAQRGYIVPADVTDAVLVCLKIKETTDVLNELVATAGYKPKSIFEVDEVEVAASFVVSLNGFFVIPDFMCDVFEASRTVEIVDFESPLYLPVFFAHKKTLKNQFVSLFLDALPSDEAR